MMPWEIFNEENQNILSISCLGNPNDSTGILNKDFFISDRLLLQETEQKIKNGELWAKIIFENDIKRTCRFKWPNDGSVFQIERSTIKYVYDGQTPESSQSVKNDTEKLINFLQDNNHHFIYKDDFRKRYIVIKII